MRRAFYGSICYYGVQGGAIILDENGVNFKCNKLTIEEKYKNLLLAYHDIQFIQICRSMLLFPAVRIFMKNKEQYKFVVFSRKRFVEMLNMMRRS